MDIKFFRGLFFKRKIKLAQHISGSSVAGSHPYLSPLKLRQTSDIRKTLYEIVDFGCREASKNFNKKDGIGI